MASITLDNVGKIYPGGTRAIGDVNIDIADGEFIVLVGPSGCGKSTLLRMVAGLESITEGQIRIGDRVVNDVEPMDRDIAMVFQNYALYPHMSVRQNLAYGLKNRRTPKAEIDRRVAEAAEILQIGAFLDRKPRALSGGQRQRVAMGRAIVREPAAFLFDEPLSNLDAKLRITMRLEIKDLQKRLGTTSLYVTHDQLEAMTLADRLVVLSAGKVEQIGTPLEVYRKPASTFVAGFIGSPAMNLIKASSVPHLPGSAHAGTIGIRPEDLSVSPDGPIEMKVGAVEELGAQRLVHGQIGNEQITITMPSDAQLSDVLRLNYRPGSLHLFQAETGRRID
ncbi:sn-glycerol-3-phosphate import ATP-binding protein UgpC [Paracoccus fistulariae]|uniref:Sn-glycerol-3-phosphate import ATP-binding protein UgpC n=1 Tax=Paracoccus fistulariae TaxID=658446 RepID=A0ABY7SJ43_9RHOB|nr:sn-glycerol-3-phosphate import ATP-binding protein UgpC [Paracoccus fistulariae]MDB6180817.1 sn-glycerol-3-phosphate import ATP-binding protein UgpC [Paracoccus fistulariae]WCR06963.1 sn-glycerol-3-phosphate import ATP-binding protein UgpC [Paracoccus fistulariae]